jgi:hypothetical protein
MNSRRRIQKSRRLPKQKRTNNQDLMDVETSSSRAKMYLMVNRSINYMPSRFRTVLAFTKFYNMNFATNNFANTRFEPTNAYDVDPTLGSTAVPGFTELAGCYRFYRVKQFRVKCSFSNNDTTTSAVCYVCPVNTDPGVNTTTYQQLLSNRRSVQKIVGPSTGNGIVNNITTDVSVDDYGGVKWTGQLDAYCASTSSSPTNNIWVAVGIESSAALTNGMAVNFNLIIEIEFFELNDPAT